MFRYHFTVMKENGLHVRVAATLIAKLQKTMQDAQKLKRVSLEYNNQKVPITHFMSLVSLKIKKGEKVALCSETPISEKDQTEINLIFVEDQEDVVQRETDRLLMENSLTMEVVLQHFPVGVVIVNKENTITYVNKEATVLLDIPEEAMLNQKADSVIPSSRLLSILETGKTELAKRQKVKSRMIMANRAPIKFNNEIIGAIALFQDISPVEQLNKELHEEKNLKDKLDLVLQSVSDLIGLTDSNGKFIYLNHALSQLMEKGRLENSVQSLVGQEMWDKLKKDNDPCGKVITFPEHPPFIARLNSIQDQGRFSGAVITLSPMDNMRLLLDQLEQEKERSRYLEKELSKHQLFDPAFNKLIGESSAFRETLSMANKVAKSDATVLITGESGTGKELVAKAIHEANNRARHPFIRVNCASIPTHLIESELFGHEKGAFTGAIKTRKGKFELANYGTIFLDEIGDLELDLQAKILRVLQEREIERVGGLHPIKLDVRILAATHRQLETMIDKGTFREDLYYRLNVIPIHLPPLRKRRSDIPLLIDYFRIFFNKRLGKNIKFYEPTFIQLLSHYDWPGNIRELQNIMERVMTLEEGNVLKVQGLPGYISDPSIVPFAHHKSDADDFFSSQEELLTIEDYEKQIYARAVQLFPSFNQMAKALGVTHKTAATKVRKYQLESKLGKKYQPLW
jgi:TyrR family helix-turn-helix protein